MHTAPSVHAELLGCVQCGGTTAQTCGSTRRVLPQVTARGSHTVRPHSWMMSEPYTVKFRYSGSKLSLMQRVALCYIALLS